MLASEVWVLGLASSRKQDIKLPVGKLDRTSASRLIIIIGLSEQDLCAHALPELQGPSDLHSRKVSIVPAGTHKPMLGRSWVGTTASRTDDQNPRVCPYDWGNS